MQMCDRHTFDVIVLFNITSSPRLVNAYEGEGLVWLIGAVVCLLAAAAGPMSLSTGSGWPHSAAAPLAIANQLPLLRL